MPEAADLIRSSRTAVVLAIAALLEGCGPPVPPQPLPAAPVCESLDSLTLGQKIIVGPPIGTPGNSFQPSNMDMGARPFTLASGATVPNGFVEIENKGVAGGSGNDMEVNNAVVTVDVGPGQVLNYLRLSFGEYGGTINVWINSTLTNVDNFASINGTTISGVAVNVLSGGGGNDKGQVEFKGLMNAQGAPSQLGQFAIGGQELWIDDICFVK